jgi:hypothetical protein
LTRRCCELPPWALAKILSKQFEKQSCHARGRRGQAIVPCLPGEARRLRLACPACRLRSTTLGRHPMSGNDPLGNTVKESGQCCTFCLPRPRATLRRRSSGTFMGEPAGDAPNWGDQVAVEEVDLDSSRATEGDWAHGIGSRAATSHHAQVSGRRPWATACGSAATWDGRGVGAVVGTVAHGGLRLVSTQPPANQAQEPTVPATHPPLPSLRKGSELTRSLAPTSQPEHRRGRWRWLFHRGGPAVKGGSG